MPDADQPAKPALKLALFSHDGGFDWTVTFDCDVDLGAEALAGGVDVTLHDFPLIGRWTFRAHRDEDGDLSLVIYHNTLDVGQLGSHVSTTLQLYWLHLQKEELLVTAAWKGSEPALSEETREAYDGWSIILYPSRVEAASDDFQKQYKSASVTSFRLRVHLSQDKASSTMAETQIARLLPDDSTSPLCNNVRLFFPNTGDEGAEIWTKVSFLWQCSPYFKDMLASDFGESIQIGSKRPRTRASAGKVVAVDSAAKDFDDSDDETDELLVKEHPPSLFDTQSVTDFTYRQITVTKTAYSTYRAVIRFLETGFIRFAPLTSSCKPTGDSPTRGRAERIIEADEDDPDLPIPVSPKSTYRLAHLLQLKRLQRMCFAELEKQLTAVNVASELFDDASVCYDEWRKVIVEYVVKHWSVVSDSSSWKDRANRVKADDVPGSGGIVFELMQARDEAARKK